MIANAGSNGGASGEVLFYANSTGGTTSVEVNGNGMLDISRHNAPGVTIGSLAGSGNVFLGSNNLAVGTNGQSTAFSNVIQDGGMTGGTGGSLTMTGWAGLGGTGGSFFNSLAGNSTLPLGYGNTTGLTSARSRTTKAPGGAVSLVGTGSQTLAGTNTFSGATSLLGGVLKLIELGSLTNSSIAVAGGTSLIDNGSVTVTASRLSLNGGSGQSALLGGNAIINGNLQLNSRGDVLAPGNSTVVMSFIGTQTWNAFTYQWEVDNLTGTSGDNDYDQIDIAGALNLLWVHREKGSCRDRSSDNPSCP